MGYYSNCESDVTFDPPISEELVKEIKENLECLAYHAEVTTTGLGRPYDSGKAYTLAEDADKLTDYLGREDSVATGTITVTGEDNHDIWRLVFADEKVIVEKVTITWPDGTEYVP